jgi:lipopolysaccharide export system protein LptA
MINGDGITYLTKTEKVKMFDSLTKTEKVNMFDSDEDKKS